MTANDVALLPRRLDEVGVAVWVGGGWGVEALLGQVCRPHDDLDLGVRRDDIARCQAALQGYSPDPSAEPGLPTRLVLQDHEGRQVDLHPLRIDAEGIGWLTLPDGSEWPWLPAHGAGEGQIGGHQVACLDAETQVRHHSDYDPDLFDWHDVLALGLVHNISTWATTTPTPDWIHYRRKRVTAMLGYEPTWQHLGQHRLAVPLGLLDALVTKRQTLRGPS